MQDPVIAFWIANILAWICLSLGFLGVFVPAVPGCGLMAVGVLTYKLVLPDTALTWKFVGGVIAAALLAMLLDYLAFAWGAKRWGASNWGLAGAIVGAIAGVILLTPLIGLVVGPLLGAVAGECMGGQSFKKALKAGMGTLVGSLMAFVIRFAIAVGILIGFLLRANSPYLI